MRIQLSSLKEISRCPRYFQFSKSNPLLKIDTNASIALAVIKKCYLYVMETGYRPEWKRIIGWVDTRVFRDVDISNEEVFDSFRRKAEYILIFLGSWYHQYMEKDNSFVYVDVPVSRSISEHHEIHSNISIIRVGKYPTILLVSDIAANIGRLYNDIELRGQHWLLEKNLDAKDICIDYLVIGVEGGIEIQKLYLTAKDLKNIEGVLYQLTSLAVNNIDYPSVTEMCNKCRFLKECEI